MTTNKVSSSEGFTIQRRDQSYDQVKDGCFLSRWLQLHTFINFGKSICRPLAKSDMFNLNEDLYPETNLKIMADNRTAQPNLSLIELLMRKLILWEFILSGVLAMLGAGLAFSGPLVIKEIMSYLKVKKPTSAQTQTAFVYVGIWIILYFIRIFCLEYSDRLMFSQAVKVQEVLTVELLEKITKISPAYKLNLKKGELLKFLSNDVKLAFNFVRSCATLFSAPLTLIVVQAFIFKDNGLYGFVLFGVLIMAGCVQIILNRSMSRIQNEKMEIMGRRISTNIELFTSIKQVKLLGWESLIINKNMRFRKKQNSRNRKYFILANIYDLVINLTPALSVFLIFLLQLLIGGGSSFDTSNVYSTLAFIGMTYSPIKSLLTVIITVINGKAAILRIQDILKADEFVDNQLSDPALKRGYILINELRATWETDKANERFAKRNLESKDDEEGSEAEIIPVLMKAGLQSQNINFNKKTALKPLPAISKALANPKTPNLVHKRSLDRFQLSVIKKLEIKSADKVIFLSESDGGKSSFFHTLLGNLHIICGQLKYGGKIGYSPKKHWFKKATVRQNILFGMPYDAKKLKRIYSHVLLQQELTLLPKGDQTVIKNLSNITEDQKRKMSLARALYSQPDILILDAVFQTFDEETKQSIYGNLCKNYKITMLISSHSVDFIKPEDKVILLQNGALKETGNFKDLTQNPLSYIHKLIQKEQQVHDRTQNLEQKVLIQQQKLQRQRKLQTRKRKLRGLIKQLVFVSRSMTKQQIIEKIIKPAEEAAKLKTQTITKVAEVKRPEGVPYTMYFKFFASSSVLFYFILFFLSLLTQATKVFSDWWVGTIKSLPWKLTDMNAMFVYIGLTVGFCLFFAFGGFLSPIISSINAETILSQLTRSLTLKQFSWYETFSPLKVAGRLNRDYEQYFSLNSMIQNIFKNFLLFIATVVLVGYKTPVFFAIAAGVLALNICILILFMRVEREMAAFSTEPTDAINNNFDDVINGIDVIRAFNRVVEYREGVRKNAYDVQVFKMNNKFLYQGMNILCEFTSLIIIAGTTLFAVSSKTSTLSAEEIAVIGTAISLCTKLTGTMTSVIKDCVNLEIGIKGAVKNAYDMIDKDLQKNFDTPLPPIEWPRPNNIEFKNVTLRYEGIDKPIVTQVNFSIDSGQNVVVLGKEGYGSRLLLAATNRYFQPSNNPDSLKGSVAIGNINLQDIGRKYISRKVMMLTSIPFIFTGTVRQNINPFDKTLENDQEIHRCLQEVKLWDEISIDPIKEKHLLEEQDQVKAKLSHILQDGGSELSLGLQQKLNIARALYWKPNILLCDSATCSVDDQSEAQLQRSLRNQLKQTTIMTITADADTAADSDKIICMYNGRVKQQGKPEDLFANPKSMFAKRFKDNPIICKKLELKKKKMLTSKTAKKL